MVVEGDNPPPPPITTTTADRLIPFSISNKVPTKLDLEKHNYNYSWSSFFLIHLGSLGLRPYVEEEVSSTNLEWSKLDDLIKMWILGSLCDSLQEQVVTTSGNAKALWDHLKDLFYDNKHARAINLDNELRSIKIRKMSINEYCTKIKSMEDRLKNLGCVVSEMNLVIYTVNGLDSRFATFVGMIWHCETLPTFETVRNMLLLKESSFNDHIDASTTFESSSSSPTILKASTPSDAKADGNLKELSANLKAQAKILFGNENVWVEMHRGISWDKVENPDPQSTSQVLLSIKEYTPPVTYPKEVEETIGIPIKVEPFVKTPLEDLGLNTCNHDIPLSSNEIPSFDEPEPQFLPNFSPLDVNLGDKKGTDPLIKPHSPDSFRIKVVDPLTIHTPHSLHVASFRPKDIYCYYHLYVDDPKKHYGFKLGLLGQRRSLSCDFSNLEAIVNNFLEGLSSPVTPKEVENDRIKGTHHLEHIIRHPPF
nr:hybrid signal transduction histidine kinase M [Tanacetum cinerariifolium]